MLILLEAKCKEHLIQKNGQTPASKSGQTHSKNNSSAKADEFFRIGA